MRTGFHMKIVQMTRSQHYLWKIIAAQLQTRMLSVRHSQEGCAWQPRWCFRDSLSTACKLIASGPGKNHDKNDQTKGCKMSSVEPNFLAGTTRSVCLKILNFILDIWLHCKQESPVFPPYFCLTSCTKEMNPRALMFQYRAIPKAPRLHYHGRCLSRFIFLEQIAETVVLEHCVNFKRERLAIETI